MPNLPDESKRSLEECLLLLAHSARIGKAVPAETVVAIYGIRNAEATGNVTTELEMKLLTAHAALVALLSPATIDGIKACDYDKIGIKGILIYAIYLVTFGRYFKKVAEQPAAIRAAMNISCGAIGILLILVVYLLYATSQLAMFQTLRQNDLAATAIETEIATLTATSADDTKMATSLSPSTPAYAEAAAKARDDNIKKADAEVRLARAMDSAEVAQSTLLKNLSVFDFVWHFFGSIALIDPELAKPNTPPTEWDRQVALAQIRLSLIHTLGFFVPGFAGLLGAYVYGMRDIARKLEADSYTEESMVQYRIRFILGPLAGIAIGLITSSHLLPTGASPLESVVSDVVADTVTVSVLAAQFTFGFIVGYCTDIFFAIVDGIIAGLKK